MVEVGLIGKPNVGKSTFFYALTLKPVEISNRPFTTIEPNLGIGFVKKKCVHLEFNLKYCNPQDGGFCLKGFRFIPVKVYDIAGLVPEAHKGKGLGNKFLDEIRRVEGFVLVIDASASTDEEGNVVGIGKGEPERDIEFVIEELNIWFYNVIKRNFDKIVKEVKVKKLEAIEAFEKILSGLNITRDQVEKTIKELNLSKPVWEWNNEDLKEFSYKLREISKPFVVAANKIDIEYSKEVIKGLKEKFKSIDIIPTSAQAELILKKLAKEGFIDYIPGESSFKVIKEISDKNILKALEIIEKVLKEYKSTGVQDAINKLVFDKLNYIVVYPVATEKLTDNKGNILPNAFLVKKNTKLIDFVSKIHSDFAKYFVKGVDIKTKKFVGKDYILKDNDVIRIIISK